ncbi:IS110 family RNA-guided transposase [Catenuloplanes japonicus]|uniref:IS110 family transposase n=1 Tax=Catenuloplanes japonicus TaxID=33876 RepID=UPI000524A98C|nr:IS110 family transposase [Catenuloplanes japonicus]
MSRSPRFYCGIDWATALNDVAVIDRDGTVLARARIPATPDGLRDLFTILDGLRASHTHGRRHVPIAIETHQGLLVAGLLARKQPVFHIPPSNVARVRRHKSPAAKKSDRSDAELLALMLRDEWAHLRPIPANTPDATAITVLAHAQWRAQRHRQQLHARLRALLVQAHPAGATAWDGRDHGLRRAEARAVLAAGPTATTAARLTPYRLSKILTGVRTRLIDDEAYRLHALFTAPVLRLPTAVEHATAVEVRALLHAFDQACTTTDDLTTALTDAFLTHPHADIYLSFPGCGPLTGARLLAEIGDDPTRFTTARGLRAYAGLAPLTWASGTSHTVTHRRICNRRLKLTTHRWAFSSLTRSPGARTHYDHRRELGDTYPGALRRLAGHLLAGLHHCLRHHTPYDEDRAFPASPSST